MIRTATVLVVTILLLITFLPLASAGSVNPNSNTRTPIKHVIEIMMENHSFDNLFGAYPRDNNTSLKYLETNISRPVNLLTPGNHGELHRVPTGTFSTVDPGEGYTAYHIDWNNGQMNGFVNGSGPQSMTYFTSSQAAPEWILAEQYAMDQSAYSMMTETTPNRLYNLAGFSPVMNDYGPPPYIPVTQSMFGELSHYSVSWNYYLLSKSDRYAPLNFFQGINQYSSNIGSWENFAGSVRNNTLPSVSWVMPVGSDSHGYYSQGPPNSILTGEMWMMYIVNLVMHSPEWNSTAIFITYDEGGGYYDQVAPPVFNGMQLGQRVPFLLISPFAKENYISSTVLDQGSIPAFIDYNWNLPALNSFVSGSNIALDMFDFNHPYSQGFIGRTPINLTSYGIPIPDNIVFTAGSTHGMNFSPIFPVDFQIPVTSLPYSESGHSSFSLSSINSSLFVRSNSSFTPLYENDLTIALILVTAVASSLWLPYLLRRRG